MVGQSSKEPTARYGEPKGRVFEQARDMTTVTIVAKNADGAVFLWSTGNQHDTEALLRQAAPAILEPQD